MVRIPAKLATNSGDVGHLRSEATLGGFNIHLHGQLRSTKTKAVELNIISFPLKRPAT
jgi:hypothetical protein